MVGNTPVLSERLWSTLASAAVRKVQLTNDLTDRELADNIGCCDQTVGNARNQKGQLAGRTLFNLMRVDPLAIEGFLHHFGRRSVLIEAKCSTDALVTTSAAVHSIALAQSPASPGKGKLTDGECLQIEGDIDAALEALSALKARCCAIRLERAA